MLPDGHEKILELGNKTQHLYYECVRKHGHEACVNWDAALVFAGGFALCSADTITGRNVVNIGGGKLRTVGRCDERDDTKSDEKSLSQKSEQDKLEIALMSTEPSLNDVDGSWTEGCVAIEHLQDAGMLQHVVNWRRGVLCWDEFCATPNHAIIVDGEWTSMKRLCDTTWSCTRSVKLVNNLSVFGSGNRRWKVSTGSNLEIVITPYDVRIPKPVTWSLQLFELVIVPVGVIAALFMAFVSGFCLQNGLCNRNK